MISIVVATDTNRVIGRENKIPWRLRDDLINLRKLTTDHAVILGRKTYESMLWYYNRSGKRFPGGLYVVVTRDTSYDTTRENAVTAHTIEDAVAIAQVFDTAVFVLGGAVIYDELLPFTDRIYLTEVQTQAEGDVYFPSLDMTQWREASRERHSSDEHNEFDYDLVVLDKA